MSDPKRLYPSAWSRNASILLLTGCAFVLGYIASDFSLLPGDRPSKPIRSLRQSIHHIQKDYFRDVSDQHIQQHALKGITNQLDPNTSYLPPKKYQQFKDSTRGQYVGVGMIVEKEPDTNWIRVLVTFPNSPASINNIQPEDLITHVEGQSTRNMKLPRAVRIIKGEKGTAVQLTIRSPETEEDRTITLKRDRVQVKAIPQYGLLEHEGSAYGYIHIREFSEKLSNQLPEVLKKLEPKSNGVIIDLRNNPGGLLSACMNAGELFLDRGKTYFKIHYRNRTDEQKMEDEAFWPRKPIVLLINHQSASASEILAGALRDHLGAKLVGQQTYGKGTVQQTYSLPTNDAIKLTVAEYLTPSGKHIYRKNPEKQHKGGLKPDYAVPLADTEEKRREIRKTLQQSIHDAYQKGPAFQNGASIYRDDQLRKALNVVSNAK